MDEAYLQCIRGELLNQVGDPAEAERSYCFAIDVAKRQGAKFYELRAATSLACLWRDQGRHTEARNLLAPVYNWFTEGLDTRFLKEARALLEQLSS